MIFSFRHIWLILCVLFLFANMCSAGFFVWKSRSIEEIPNPMIKPQECGRPGVVASAVCDPDERLTKEMKDRIEGKLNDLKPHAEMAVVIIDQMKTSGFWPFNSIDASTEKFARTLHNTWGVGNKDTQNGVLLFLSIKDRSLFISIGEGVSGQLTDSTLDYIISSVKSYLKRGNHGDAILSMISQIELALINPDQLQSNRFYTYLLNYVGIAVLIAFLLFRSIGYGCGLYYGRRVAQYQKGNRVLTTLLHDVQNAAENKYAISSCPICLEEFGTTVTHQSVSNGNGIPGSSVGSVEEGNVPPLGHHTQKPIVGLSCGHVFCQECITSYLQYNHRSNQAATCPICRQSVTTTNASPSSTPLSAVSESRRSTWNQVWDTILCCYLFRYFQLLEWQQSPSPTNDPVENEIRFRLYRAHQLYPWILPRRALGRMFTDGHRRDYSYYHGQLSLQVQENERVISSAQASHVGYQTKFSSGKSGSSSRSFGGGRSFGGRGGRW